MCGVVCGSKQRGARRISQFEVKAVGTVSQSVSQSVILANPFSQTQNSADQLGRDVKASESSEQREKM